MVANQISSVLKSDGLAPPPSRPQPWQQAGLVADVFQLAFEVDPRRHGGPEPARGKNTEMRVRHRKTELRIR